MRSPLKAWAESGAIESWYTSGMASGTAKDSGQSTLPRCEEQEDKGRGQGNGQGNFPFASLQCHFIECSSKCYNKTSRKPGGETTGSRPP